MRIAVAMSGGMDSTAAALLLKRAGHEVIGLHMRLHSASESSLAEAQAAARAIDVPLFSVDLSQQFSDLIVRPFVSDYAAGLTPSPCPRCNRIIKMSSLWDIARGMGCERIATGHYARTSANEYGCGLLAGLDKAKDQSYFLFALTSDMLRQVIFPLGSLTKTSVRELLRRENIHVWRAEESQELCFIPKGDYRTFLLKNGVVSRPGPIKNTTGAIVGEHKGIVGYTVGQRRGLGVCGPQPYYVVRIDAAENTLVIGTREETLTSGMVLRDVNILASGSLSVGARFTVKVRSTAKAVPCSVTQCLPHALELAFDEPQSGIAPGQAGVLYSGEMVTAGGWIARGGAENDFHE